jgi:hypothetical protein
MLRFVCRRARSVAAFDFSDIDERACELCL